MIFFARLILSYLLKVKLMMGVDVDKNNFKKSLTRMGVPIYPGDKVQKEDVLSLPFQSSGLQVTHIKSIKTEQFPGYTQHRIHLKIKGGDADKIDSAVAKNKGAVEQKLSGYYGQQSNGILGPVKLNMHSRNNTNCWLDLLFYYNPKAFLCHDSSPFCYHLLERS